MTEEEINELKVGDKFKVEYRVEEATERDVDVRVSTSAEPYFYTLEKSNSVMLHTGTLVKPSPNFEVGDTVRIVKDPLTGHVHGHEDWIWDNDEGCIGHITSINTNNCNASVEYRDKTGHAHMVISLHCLELIKKAERNKYEIKDHCSAWAITFEQANITSIVASFTKSYHPKAEAAARAECDRLNAEWRKQQDSANA